MFWFKRFESTFVFYKSVAGQEIVSPVAELPPVASDWPKEILFPVDWHFLPSRWNISTAVIRSPHTLLLKQVAP
jgi:hypothetical protein